MLHSPCLRLIRYSFIQTLLHWINPSILQSAHWTSSHIRPLVYSLSNPTILHSFKIKKRRRTLHPIQHSVFCLFFLYQANIYLSFSLHVILSLLYFKTGTNRLSCSILYYSQASSTFLSFAPISTFLQHSYFSGTIFTLSIPLPCTLWTVNGMCLIYIL